MLEEQNLENYSLNGNLYQSLTPLENTQNFTLWICIESIWYWRLYFPQIRITPPPTPFFYTQPKPDKQHRMREGSVLNIIGYGMIWGSGVILVLGIEQGQRTFRAVSLLWAVCLTKSMYVLLFCFSFVDGVRDSAQGCTHVRQIAHHWTTPQSLSCWYL